MARAQQEQSDARRGDRGRDCSIPAAAELNRKDKLAGATALPEIADQVAADHPIAPVTGRRPVTSDGLPSQTYVTNTAPTIPAAMSRTGTSAGPRPMPSSMASITAAVRRSTPEFFAREQRRALQMSEASAGGASAAALSFIPLPKPLDPYAACKRSGRESAMAKAPKAAKKSSQAEAALRRQSADREGAGDAPVQAYIAAMPGWKSALGRRLDAIITRARPRRGQSGQIQLAALRHRGRWLVPRHPCLREIRQGGFLPRPLAASPAARRVQDEGRCGYLDIREDAPFDEAQSADWVKQASERPGERSEAAFRPGRFQQS